MFRITNNNISITRGETATYDAVFKHSDGIPLTLDKSLVSDDKSIYGLFSVKLSMYDEDAVFRVPMKLDDLATFDTSKPIINIGNESFDNSDVPETNVTFETSTERLSNIDGTGRVVQRGTNVWKNSIDGYTYYSGRYVATLYAAAWVTLDTPFTGIDVLYGENVWHDVNGDTYYLGEVDRLGQTKKFLKLTGARAWTELTYPTGLFINGTYVWNDGVNTYYSHSNDNYVFSSSNTTFTTITFATKNNIEGNKVFNTADGKAYYCDGTNTYMFNSSTQDWVLQSNMTPVDGDDVFVFNNRTFYANGTDQRELINGVWVNVDLGNINQGKLVWHYDYNDTHDCYFTNTNSYSKAMITTDDRDCLLYKRTISGVPYYYKYVGTTDYVTEDDFEEYEFRMVFPFPYNIMKTLQPKLYKYEIALIGGTPTDTIEGQAPITSLPMDIDFKQYLVEFKDFKVEGSLSE